MSDEFCEDHEFDDDDDDESGDEVPDGAAVFPLIPPDVEIHPMLLASLHAVVFFIGSSDEVIAPDAAEEAAQYIISYLQRLQGPDLQRVREDMEVLIQFAKDDHWPDQDIQFLKTFLKEFHIEKENS